MTAQPDRDHVAASDSGRESDPRKTPGSGQAREIVALLRRNAEFRRLFAASVVSFLGDWFALVAVSALVKDLTGREGSTALVFAAQVLPIFFVAPLGGVLADRLDRRRIMVGSSVLRIVPALGLLAVEPLGAPWLAYVCVLSISALAAFYEPLVSAVLPNLVDRDDLSLAQAVLSSVWGSMLFIGAAVGGLVSATLGRDASFVINAATFAVAAVLILRIRRPFRSGAVAAPATVLAHLGEVWQFVKPHKVRRAFLVTKPGVGIGNGIVGLLPVYALDVFASGDAGVGLLLAGRGLGALLGPYVGRRLVGDDGRRHVWIAGVSILSYAVAYAMLPFVPTLLLAVVCVTVAHLGGGNQWVLSTYGLQLTTPDRIRGRVMSLDFALATLASGVSALVAGGAAEVFGLRSTTIGMAVAAFLFGAVWLAWTRDLWRSSEDPVAAAAPDEDGPPTASA